MPLYYIADLAMSTSFLVKRDKNLVKRRPPWDVTAYNANPAEWSKLISPCNSQGGYGGLNEEK